MAGPGGESCGGCRFWDNHCPGTTGNRFEPVMLFEPGSDNAYAVIETGKCRRNPPATETDDTSDGDPGGMGRWLFTRADDWCGEYRPREVKKR